MVYASVLGLHILALFVTVGVGLYTLYAVAFSKAEHYRACALVIGSIAGFQVFSGTVLALLSPTLSAAALTLHVATYLGACLVLEALIFVRTKNLQIAFPLTAAASPVLASLVLFVVAISYNL